MRILNVTTITEWRGGDAQMYTIYKLLKKNTTIIPFILCPHNAELAKKCAADGANYQVYTKNGFKIINAVRKIIHICKKELINIVHVHDSSALNAGLLALTFLPESTKLVFSRKRNNPIKKNWLSRYKYSRPSIEKIICVSKAVEAIFYPVIKNKDKLVTIYDAIDVSHFSTQKKMNKLHTEYKLSQDTLIIGNIAGLTEQKDLFTFIDTAQKILSLNSGRLSIKFFLIGTGPLMDDLKSYAASLQLADDIIFTGYRNDVAALLPEFDLLLLTSINEGLPLTIFEAFACKVPVVATRAGGIAEAVIDNGTGFVCNLKDITCLSERSLKVISDAGLAQRFRESAFQKVKSEYDLPVLERNYYNFYKSLCN